MAIEKTDIDAFLELAKKHPVIDVRSPAEYDHAHIPGALNFPLFTNEERKIVGTAYKQESRQMAIQIGLDFFGVKMRSLVVEIEKLHTTTLLVHCWRGGMRSAAVAWLFDLYGFKVFTLSGGYKKFRHYVLQTFEHPFNFNLLSGFTGTGKTSILHELAKQGESVIDLEALAHHKGSAFGGLGQPSQPSQEMFENRLALELQAHCHLPDCSPTTSRDKRIWLEDESQRIGTLTIPQSIWNRMQIAKVYFLRISAEARLDHIFNEYGSLDKDQLRDAIMRIQKRLGGLETKTAIQALEQNDIIECFRILLTYYDRCYRKSLLVREKRNQLIFQIEGEGVNDKENATRINTVWRNQNQEQTVN